MSTQEQVNEVMAPLGGKDATIARLERENAELLEEIEDTDRRPGCGYCEGEHEWEGAPYGYAPHDGSPLCEVHVCPECDGGRLAGEHRVEPITLDDLDELSR